MYPLLNYIIGGRKRGLVIGRVCSVNNFGAFAGEKQNFYGIILLWYRVPFWASLWDSGSSEFRDWSFHAILSIRKLLSVAYLCFLVVSVP